MFETIEIRRAKPADTESLVDVLLDVVDGGASVGFMSPLSRDRALAFWEGCQASAERGERLLFVAEDTARHQLLGTVQVLLAMPDNGAHRADIAKMLVRRSARRQGLGARLMRAAEQAAQGVGKTLLVLDTVTGSDADRLYASLGWVRVGDIPDYARFPTGGWCSTTVFYKPLGPGPG
jgi:GNAT superfamily N-acetyltransferase